MPQRGRRTEAVPYQEPPPPPPDPPPPENPRRHRHPTARRLRGGVGGHCAGGDRGHGGRDELTGVVGVPGRQVRRVRAVLGVVGREVRSTVLGPLPGAAEGDGPRQNDRSSAPWRRSRTVRPTRPSTRQCAARRPDPAPARPESVNCVFNEPRAHSPTTDGISSARPAHHPATAATITARTGSAEAMANDQVPIVERR